MNFIRANTKLCCLDTLITECFLKRRFDGKKITVTNGCFDLFYIGRHARYLEEASNLYPDNDLIVLVDSDESVKALKGDSRPIIGGELERALLISMLPFVTRMHIFKKDFLIYILNALKPEVYVKSESYTLQTMNQDERKTLDSIGTEIRFLRHIEGVSTTNIIKKINNL